MLAVYYDAEGANRRIGQLEKVIAAISERCLPRLRGKCVMECPGRGFCDVRGLDVISAGEPGLD